MYRWDKAGENSPTKGPLPYAQSLLQSIFSGDARSWILVPILLSFLAAGCAAISSTLTKEAETLVVCVNGESSPAAGRFTREQLIGGLLVMLKANENAEAVLCAAKPGSWECKRESLRWFVQGGPIPGVASYKKPYVTQATDGTAKEPALISVGQLSPQILAAPVPTQEEVKKSKGEIDPAERTLWESVSKKNTADGYREYLSRYAEGRFADAAKANLRVIEEREAQNRELAFWSKIKESTDPKDFESYMAKYPKGLFVDLALVRAQRLRAAATEAAAMDAELAFWDQVKGSTDVNEIQVYLKHYPSGQFASIARNRIKKLTAASQEKSDLEMEMWTRIKDSRKQVGSSLFWTTEALDIQSLQGPFLKYLKKMRAFLKGPACSMDFAVA